MVVSPAFSWPQHCNVITSGNVVHTKQTVIGEQDGKSCASQVKYAQVAQAQIGRRVANNSNIAILPKHFIVKHNSSFNQFHHL